MGYVPECKCDVFVSFAHLDDVGIGSSPPWVSAFAADLKKVLRMRLGARDDTGLSVYFTGHSSLEAGINLEEALTENAAAAATFVAVTSPAYVSEGAWPLRELGAFLRGSDGARRIFAIEHSPLDRNDDYPPPLRDLKRMPFWQLHPHREVPVTFTVGSEIYVQALFDLAEQIRRELKMLREGGGPAAPEFVASPGVAASLPIDDSGAMATTSRPAAGSKIFLAQVTDDLEAARDQVRRYVEQYDVAVVPSHVYPQGGAEFGGAVEADLADADMFVQLLGPAHAKRPPDVPQGYDRLQLERAIARDMPILQWTPPDIDPTAVKDQQHAALLAGEHVMRTGLESFKADIVKRLQAKSSLPAEADRPEHFVFINADGSDLALAKDLKRALADANFSAAVPFLQGSAEDIRLDLEENIVDCDALLMVYGQSPPVWVRGQLRLYAKLKHRRRAPLKALAIYLGPPEAKPDLGMDLPECQEIDCREGLVPETVRQFLAGIHS